MAAKKTKPKPYTPRARQFYRVIPDRPPLGPGPAEVLPVSAEKPKRPAAARVKKGKP